MPVSPNSRGGEDKSKTPNRATPQTSPNLNGSDGTEGDQSKRSRRKTLQNLKRRFADLRERAQLAGIIPTVPEGAVRDERVKHDDPKLIERAIKQGWAVPDEIKPELVAELTAIVTDDSEETSDKTKVAAFRALLAADQAQHERDNPHIKNSKTPVNISVQTNIAAVDILRQSMKKVDTTPQITSEEEQTQQ